MKELNLKILYVTTHLPSPPRIGAQHRVLNIGKCLKSLGKVAVVYIGRETDGESLGASKKDFGDIVVMRPKTWKGPGWWIKLREKINFHCPFHYGDKVSKNDRELFQKLYSDCDLVWFHTLTSAGCLGLGRVQRSVMDIDDLNYRKYQMRSEHYNASLREKIAHKMLVFKWKRRELDALKRFSVVTVCSGKDKHLLGDKPNIRILPNGFEKPAQKPVNHTTDNKRIGFIGSLIYGPNKDGLKWFGTEVMPLITKQAPDVKLRIVGQTGPKDDFVKYPGFEALGFVDDPADEFGTWSAMIVPLRYGGGTRLKILEAFSRMCPVVSTKVGAYGLEVTDNVNIMLAEEPVDFAAACMKLLKEPETRDNLAKEAWQLFESKYTWEKIGETIKKITQNTDNIL